MFYTLLDGVFACKCWIYSLNEITDGLILIGYYYLFIVRLTLI